MPYESGPSPEKVRSAGDSEQGQAHHDVVRSLGLTFRQLRALQGLSQEEVALRAGVSVQSYGCLERGQSPSGGAANPTLYTLLRIFQALGIEPPSLST